MQTSATNVGLVTVVNMLSMTDVFSRRIVLRTAKHLRLLVVEGG